MNPVLTPVQNLKLAGLKLPLRQSLTSTNDLSGIPGLWQKLPVFSNRVGDKRFALITGDLPQKRADIAYYYALVEVSSFDHLPDDISTYEIENAKLAKFIHVGPPSAIGQTSMRALLEWLPQANESIKEYAELMIFPAHYDRTNPQSSFEFCLILNP